MGKYALAARRYAGLCVLCPVLSASERMLTRSHRLLARLARVESRGRSSEDDEGAVELYLMLQIVPIPALQQDPSTAFRPAFSCDDLVDRMQARHARQTARTTSRRLASTTSAANINATAVERGDHPAFLIATSYPPSLRDSYVALRAFNIELASVSESVSNPALGTLRMKFWRDAITSVFEVLFSPVLLPRKRCG